MNAANIMVTDMPLLGEGSTLSDAFALMGGAGPCDIPVLGKDGRVAGIFEADRLLAELSAKGEELSGAVKECADMPVSRYVTGEFSSVGPDNGAAEIFNIFLDTKKSVRIVMVTDCGGRLLGVITPGDLMKSLCEYVEKKTRDI